jgi:hypothetical protein
MAQDKFTTQLQSYLQQHSQEQLSQWLCETICADKVLKKQWQIKLLLASGKPSDYKKLLTQALPKKNIMPGPGMWGKVAAYFRNTHELLNLAFKELENPDCSLSNEEKFNWILQAFERINFVLRGIDDSGGYRLALVEQLGKCMVNYFHLLEWPIEQKVQWLAEHQYKYDVFPYIPEDFELTGELAKEFQIKNEEGQIKRKQEMEERFRIAKSKGLIVK